jgi:exopolysaccharide biosynthesis polyprenyl glycosylphosphotransferase
MGLYKPKRIQNTFVQLVDILKASIFGGLFVVAFFYYIQDVPYSRKLLVLFAITLFAGLVFSHLLTMVIMRRFRARGYNLRYYAVIGTGQKAQQLVRDIEQMEWLGLKCVLFVDNNTDNIGTELLGIPVYGPVEKLTELAKTKAIDEVYLALSGNKAQKAYPILEALQSAGVTIRIMPDWGNLASISGATVITIGSQVLFSAADSPLRGVNIVLKEVFDRTIALILLTISAIPIGLIAILIKLTSKGPVFYKQRRVGMDQKEFEMFKFRTMVVDAEKENGPQWTKHNDPRRTLIGAWLRCTSLDELPQFINVVKGQMSLVGPRPERPVFAKQFSEEYKKYMLRHKVKAGMTGWAQINGFRGDTSLRKRLLYDLYYVKNWSWGLDIWILLRTPWHIIKGENAY